MVQKLPPHKQWIDVRDAVREVLTLVGSQADRHNVLIDSSLADDMPPVWADRVQVQQVILNLVMNAIEAMADTPDGLRRISVASRRADEKTVHVSVRDHGSGVSPEASDRLFEPFYSTKPNGLGMGLATSRGIVPITGSSGRARTQIAGRRFSLPCRLLRATDRERFTGRRVRGRRRCVDEDVGDEPPEVGGTAGADVFLGS
jgi:C4-dicarboxylate-specific signal transduction histidine kinase